MSDLNIKELYDTLDEEVDIYSIINLLEDETEEELRFIINSFSKYFVKMCNSTDLTYLEIVRGFEASLEAISSGLFGTGLKTEAVDIYKKLPTFIAILEIGNKQSKSVYNTLTELKTVKERNHLLEKQIDKLEDTIKRNSTSSSSSSSWGSGRSSSHGSCGGSSSGSSYGGCGGSSSRSSSYGGCGGGSTSYGRC